MQVYALEGEGKGRKNKGIPGEGGRREIYLGLAPLGRLGIGKVSVECGEERGILSHHQVCGGGGEGILERKKKRKRAREKKRQGRKSMKGGGKRGRKNGLVGKDLEGSGEWRRRR